MGRFLVVFAAVIAATAFLSASPVNGCSTPLKGCVNCTMLKWAYVYFNTRTNTLVPEEFRPTVGNKTWGTAGSVNYERFKKLVGTPNVANLTVSKYTDCCTACARTTGCSYYHFFFNHYNNTNKVNPNMNFNCYLTKNAPNTGVDNGNVALPISIVGGKCNASAGVVDDPHFVGGHGTRFDFNGEVGRPFCLITDKRLHINTVLDGYIDERTYGASTQNNGKAIRSWIRMLSIMWKDESGSKHSVLLKARDGTEQGRGDGFIEFMRMDINSVELPRTIGEKISGPGGFSLTLKDQKQRGLKDMDVYHLVIEGILNADISLRVAHPLLQTREEAFAHFNLHVYDIEASPEIHGILGQTFRNDATRVVRALEYKMLARLLNAPVQADGSSGKGFLDGEASDYITSSEMGTDCKYATAWSA